jgi:predicted amidohydrolase YtcJ
MQAYELMKAADANRQLSLRYIVYLPGFTLKSAAEARELIARWNVAQDAGDEWVRIGGVKLLVDGGFEGGHMSAPYAEPYGHGGTFSGVTVVQPQAYAEVVSELNGMGWRVATHAVGDAAVEQVLNAYQAADAEHSIAGKRWTVEHAFVVNPGQLKRLKKLDIAVSAQDHLYLAAPVLKKYWGAKRAAEVTPMKDFIQAGLLVASGTDSPVIPFNPFWTLYHFASRDTISDGVYGPDQKITSRSVLLKLATINYAKLIGEAADKGSIEPGKLADFAILTDDFLTVPLPRLRDMEALATYVGGKEVYRAAGYVPRIDGQGAK